MDTASNAALENEFGTHNEEECVKKILRGGTSQTKTVSSHLVPPVSPIII